MFACEVFSRLGSRVQEHRATTVMLPWICSMVWGNYDARGTLLQKQHRAAR